jgi:site-specific recombinase XerD
VGVTSWKFESSRPHGHKLLIFLDTSHLDSICDPLCHSISQRVRHAQRARPPNHPSRQHPRNAALLRLIYAAGLRINESCGLRWRDLIARDDGGQITMFDKGGKTRVVLLPASVWSRLTALRGDADQDAPVFLSREGRVLEASQVHRIVKAAAKRAGLSEAGSTHWLRHAHVSHALDRGAPVQVVRSTVDHASLETTTHYSHARPGDGSARYLAA